MTKGYKAFENDWTCRGFQYEVGQTYEMNVDIEVCERGFHFCENLADCFDFYPFSGDTRIAEVQADGNVKTDGTKSVTDKITIIRELTWDEVLKVCNTGDCNTGKRNTGDWNTGNWNTGNRNTGNWNTGNWNTGNRNTGNRNTGNWNTGNRNTGNRNTGDCNTGNRNTGDCNTGNRNTGNRNTGDWNKSSFNTGCFNTVEPKIMLFNKPSDMRYRDWINSDARHLLDQIQKRVVEWIYEDDMTDDEKSAYPTYKTTGGYLKVLDESECAQIWWDGLDEDDRDIIRAIPNFDTEIFYECTGIRT